MDITKLKRVLLEAMEERAVPGGEHKILRAVANFRDAALSLSEVTTITGVRRCGKSTVLQQIKEQAKSKFAVLHVEFDHPDLAAFTSDDFGVLYELWLATSPGNSRHLLLFDEIHLVDGWERWADYFSKRPNTKVIVTGSNARLLSSEFATLLTGRHIELRVRPLSLAEIYRHEAGLAPTAKIPVVQGPEQRAMVAKICDDFFKFGGFPRAYLTKSTSILSQYQSDIIERDILRRIQRVNPRYIHGLATILANESTRLFNRSNVGQVLGIKDQVTVGKYSSQFVKCFLYKELRNFSPSVRKQLRSLSKFYSVDHVFAQENGPRASSAAIFEQAVANELSATGAELFYWHSKEGLEVDLLMVIKGSPVAAVQVSLDVSDQKTLARELRALHAAKTELGVDKLLLVTRFAPRDLNLANFRELGVKLMTFDELALNGMPT